MWTGGTPEPPEAVETEPASGLPLFFPRPWTTACLLPMGCRQLSTGSVPRPASVWRMRGRALPSMGP